MRDDIARLFAAEGPFATVYLDARSDQPQAAQQLSLRWKNARRQLEEQGADPATLDALETAVDGDHRGGDTLALVGANGRVLVRELLPEPPRGDRARWEPLPWTGPLLETAQTLLPHVVVVADRTGADLYGFDDDGGGVEHEVEGRADEDAVRRVNPGGWSQRRYQQRAVNAWEDNARDVAAEVAEVADQVGARLVAIGGDVHAVRLLQEHLPERLQGRVRILESASRAVDGGVDEVADDVKRLVDTVVAEESVSVLHELKEEQGQDDRAATGPARVVEALQQAVVDTLVVDDDPDDDRRAWFGPEPVHLSLDRAGVEAMGVEQPRQGRLIDACIRAALGTGAQVRIGPRAVTGDGLAAILRHTGTSPARPGSPAAGREEATNTPS